MNDDVEREIAKHLECVHDLSIKIVDSSDTGQKAVMRAAGVLAAVIHVVGDKREEVISAATDTIRKHLRLLDELADIGAPMN
ncbi:hypothetical protein QA640_39240 [Bradyrhizobium sp. CB82]|uniref:hypothetical protein n=1 Tax=Bradyrhizobium sp. CB82 TaxID=3039159 RepID=UPI0024B08526|nr:hypothetical protein [Bradyrhizobium sp. CB82]WFU40179.1 hypothetical protein QA640_39240 [Bradyrhizobium sp. CB82]